MTRIRRVLLRTALGVAAFAGLAVAASCALGPRFSLYGNFVPNVDFSSREKQFERLDEARERDAEAIAAAPADPAAFDDAPWPQFRGPNRDGISAETGLLEAWPDGGPPEVWRRPIGVGWSGFAVGGGRAFTIEQRREDEVVSAYDLETGAELWTIAYPAAFSEQMGGDGPRATPALAGGRVFALGALGDLHCADAATGEVVWKRNVLADAGGKNLEYGTASSPLADGGRIFVASSGTDGTPGVVAYDAATGEPVLKAIAEPQAYASPAIETLAGRRVLLDFAAKELIGADPATGDVLFRFPWETNHGINVAQPIALGGDRLFVSAGYGQGATVRAVRLSESGEWTTEEIWRNANMKNKFSSSVAVGGRIYGLDEGILSCADAATGERLWKGGRHGHGQMLWVEGKLVVVGEKGEIALVRAAPERYEAISTFRALSSKTWNVPALADGRLLVRNDREAVCFDLRK